MLAPARGSGFRDIHSAVPCGELVEIFQLKYDYHNAKSILKAQAMGTDPARLLLKGGRYDPVALLDGWQREQIGFCSDIFRRAMEEAAAVLKSDRDPQKTDLLLDKA